MKPGSFAWAMEQLLAGHRVTRSNYRNKDYHIKLNDDGNIVIHTNTWCNFDHADTSATDWVVWTIPINYPVGTFPWAWKQLKAGKIIKRASSPTQYRLTNSGKHKAKEGDEEWFVALVSVPDIDATDWEVVE